MSHFLSEFSCRSLDSGWGSITKVQGHDIFNVWAINVQDARIKALVTFQFDSAGNQIKTRDAQVSWRMMTCLMNLSSVECLNKVCNSSNDHVLTSTSGEVSEDGPMDKVVIISETWIAARMHGRK